MIYTRHNREHNIYKVYTINTTESITYTRHTQ